MFSSPAAIVLAAGKGARLKAKDCNKVVYPLGTKPMISYTVDHLEQAGINQIIMVVGFQSQSVQAVLGARVIYAHQTRRLGTGHALKVGLVSVPAAHNPILSLYGDDSAFYPPALFNQVILKHRQSGAPISILTVVKTNPSGLGRIVRNPDHHVVAIVEDKNATLAQKQICEINTGLYCFERPFLDDFLPQIRKNPVSGEYYLTDLVSLAVQARLPVNAVLWPDASIWQGVNTPAELALAQERMQQRNLMR